MVGEMTASFSLNFLIFIQLQNLDLKNLYLKAAIDICQSNRKMWTRLIINIVRKKV